MASGNGTSGKATQENKLSAALESLSGPEKNQNLEILSTQNVAQDLTLSKGKQALQDSKCGHDSIDRNKHSSTSWPVGSFRDGPGVFPSSNEKRIIALGSSSSSKKRLIQALQEKDSQTYGPEPAQSNLEGVAASAAPAGATAVEPNVDSIVAHLGEASLEPNGGSLVLNNVGRAEPFVRPIVVLHGVAPVQSDVALIVALLSEGHTEPNIAPNVAPPAPAVVASNVPPRRVAPVPPAVAPQAQRDGAPPAPVQPDAALIVAPRGVALAQPNAALVVAPPGIAHAQPNAAAMVAPLEAVVLDVNHGLDRSRLKPLRICEIGSEGRFWAKLP